MSVIIFPDGSQFTSTALTDNQIETAFQIITGQMLGILTVPFQVHAEITNGMNVIHVDSLANNMYVGQTVTGSGVIPAGTTVIGIDPVTLNIILSHVCTGDFSGLLTFTDLTAPFKIRIGWQIDGEPGQPIDQNTVVVRCSTLDTEYSRMHDILSIGSGVTSTRNDVYTRAWKTHWTFYGPSAEDNARAVRSALVTAIFVESYLNSFNLYTNPDIEVATRAPDLFQGRWWPRADLEAEFNEQITETTTVGTVASVEVIGYTKDGEFMDSTFQTS